MIQDVKEAYNDVQWCEREQYYVKAISQLIIPAEPSSKAIINLEVKLDALLAEVLLETAYVRRKYNQHKTNMNLTEKEVFVIIKRDNIGSAKKPPTEKEVQGLAVEYIRTHPVQGSKHSIYDLVQRAEYRLAFIESMVKVLQEKKAALVTLGSMLKIEAGINN